MAYSSQRPDTIRVGTYSTLARMSREVTPFSRRDMLPNQTVWAIAAIAAISLKARRS